ncbi:[NiFe]-hydrogenase II apoprotein ferredoxin-type subunit [Hydrogenivirga caldilitoris]|uniref:[NiFe]-hydrogenase II apoprotein ferredoxin-type subunit n=1 Tax=Hydrogenivirga caldilitoris TaxID=246264 RepID=A0A497XNP1_9AQUI|nr:Ni/Fe hydrogenase [Hydrogenivirga caldilitoris]RLJ70555.1 [NiFe]-hydrogenase II apoprotein ferredoxin-type subunit [Hydrogenivirga caldilitoris]
MNLLWLQGLTCSGNTQSFLCAENPSADEVLGMFEVLFCPFSSWEVDMEEVILKLLRRREELNVLILEGAVGGSDHRVCKRSFAEVVRELSRRADYVIALGNCAVFGNIPAKYDQEVKGLQYRFKQMGGVLGRDFRSRSGLPVINLSGCPAHPSWLSYVLLQILSQRKIELDELGRPKELYAYLTHHGCIRNEYFEWKVEAEELGKKEGCLFYYFGCKGPMTHSSCNRILWNGLSSKTRVGMPCVGCTEYDFPREGMLETRHLMGIPDELPLGVSKRGYILISGIAKTFAPERLKKRLMDEDSKETAQQD